MTPRRNLRSAADARWRRRHHLASLSILVMLIVAGGALAWGLLAGTEAVLGEALPRTGKAFTATATTSPSGDQTGPEGPCPSPSSSGRPSCHVSLPGEDTGAEPAGPGWLMLLAPLALGLLAFAASGRRR
ncbi:hypothetical protein HUT19_41050 [Streptomyces sp. NA02950]|uniref:hypothetical protein n=1 Tax=Streptomyces sp. NA02950 TaxID=2742137 RepID=UPI001590A7E4|nr:hypothetical protein [Streptomyces sp. NA02950]QKV90396.1 hypothetical protein HUT19_00170 [Streptomyces sp. NA02950]QKV97271.1 hypothetical protein HUT19_41050 [Streptomyces sp. NA02950]